MPIEKWSQKYNPPVTELSSAVRQQAAGETRKTLDVYELLLANQKTNSSHSRMQTSDLKRMPIPAMSRLVTERKVP